MLAVDQFLAEAPDARVGIVAVSICLGWPSTRSLSIANIAGQLGCTPATLTSRRRFKKVRLLIYRIELPRVALGSQRKTLVQRLQAHLAFRQRIPTCPIRRPQRSGSQFSRFTLTFAGSSSCLTSSFPIAGDARRKSHSKGDCRSLAIALKLCGNQMKIAEIARRYNEAWNGSDVGQVTSFFAKDGTFCNPDTYPGVKGDALAGFVQGVWTAVPDFSLELLNGGEIEPGVVAHHWRISGTDTAPGPHGNPPSGRKFSFTGASIIYFEGDKIRLENSYFDSKGLDKQLAGNLSV